MRTFFEQVSSLSSQPFPRCWGTPASKIPICCQYLNKCQHPLQQNLNWLKYVSVRVYVLLLLFISKEWNFVPVMIFVGKVAFFVGKVLEIYDPKLFAYQNILALCTLCLETAPRRKRFWKYFRGGAEVIFSGQGRAVLKVLRGWASQGTLFQARTCAPAHPWSSVSIFDMFNFYSTSAIAGVLWFAFGLWSPEIFRREHCILSNDCTNPNSTQAINKPQERPP